MVILFNATLFTRLGDGPFWRHITESEYALCRKYWWENVLMINNFMIKESVRSKLFRISFSKSKHLYVKFQCAQHTWFLAADMQLYELFLITVILTSK